jgi:hypothetical protein
VIATLLTVLLAGGEVLGLPEEAKGSPPGVGTAGSDALVLKDGKRLSGTLLDITESECVVKTAEGKVFVARKDIAAIERAREPGLAPLIKSTEAPAKSVEDWRRLARICARQDAFPEERECWRRLLKLAPDDAEARARLGEASLDGRWLAEKEVEAKLKQGHRIVDGALKRKPATVVAKGRDGGEDAKAKKGSSLKGKASKAKSRAQTIEAVDLLAKVLEERDPHSLWMLLCRSGVRAAEVEGQLGLVNLKFAREIVEKVAKKKGDYKVNMKAFLDKHGAPRDWQAHNQQAIAEFKKKHGKGIHLETKFYHILSTASQELTQELGQKMDVVTVQVYHKIFEFEEKIPFKYILRFWKDRTEYVQNGGSPGSAAHYQPATKELVGYNLRADGMTLMDPFQTLFHEGWHQYFDFYIPNAPRWFDEGFAEVISPTIVKGNKASWKGYNANRSSVVGQAAAKNQLIPLRDVIRMSHEDFYESDRIGLAYAQAWSFIYFLTTYTNPSKKQQDRVRNFYKDYFWELHKGTDPVEAVDIVFGDVKFETLEAAWIQAIPRQK